VPDAEAALNGSDGGAEAAAAAAAAAASAATPISDVRGSAEYRRAMAVVITRRSIAAAVTRARGGAVPIPASPAMHGAS
jgi:carbon-monoxide dehydrogenase medium subunit